MSASDTDLVAELAARAKSGSREAFSELVLRFRNVVFGYSLARFRNRELAEEATQESFVKAFLSLSQLKNVNRFEPWLMEIVRNKCHDLERRKKVRATEPIHEGSALISSHEDAVIDRLESEQLQRVIQLLPEHNRIPLLMYYESGLSRPEIASALGVSFTTVAGRLAQALTILRRELNPGGDPQ